MGQDLGPYRHPGCDREQLLSVAPRQVRNRADRAFSPEQLVGEGGDIAHVDAGADDRRPLRGGAQRRRDERPDRGEDDRCLEQLRRSLAGAPRPLCAERARERLSLLVAVAGEGEDAPALMHGDLADDVGRRAEAIEAEALRVPGEAQRPVPDHPGAEQRRDLLVRMGLRKREGEALVGARQLGVAAVAVVPGEAGAVAEVLPPGQAIAAGAVRPAEPGNADPIALLEALRILSTTHDGADDLVPQDQRQLRLGQLAVHDVQVGAADAAGSDLDQDLARARLGVRDVRRAQRLTGAVEHHRSHRPSLPELVSLCRLRPSPCRRRRRRRP
jgi:hypothetical protein